MTIALRGGLSELLTLANEGEGFEIAKIMLMLLMDSSLDEMLALVAGISL